MPLALLSWEELKSDALLDLHVTVTIDDADIFRKRIGKTLPALPKMRRRLPAQRNELVLMFLAVFA